MVDGKVVLTYDPRFPIRLVIITDWHCGHPGFDEKGLTAFLQEEMANPNTWLISLGDAQESITANDKRWVMSSCLLPPEKVSPDMTYTEYLNRVIDYQVEQAARILDPYRDRILGLVMGNHEWKAVRWGTHPHARLCEMLGVENLGYEFFKNIVLNPGYEKPKTHAIKIYGHHGWTAPRKPGTALNTYMASRAEIDFDLGLFGHCHFKLFHPAEHTDLDRNGKYYTKHYYIAVCGTWKKSRSRGPDPYWEETRGFSIRVLDGMVLKLLPQRDGRVKVKMD